MEKCSSMPCSPQTPERLHTPESLLRRLRVSYTYCVTWLFALFIAYMRVRNQRSCGGVKKTILIELLYFYDMQYKIKADYVEKTLLLFKPYRLIGN